MESAICTDEPDDADFDAECEAAEAMFELEDRIEPRAVKAWHEPSRDLVMFEIRNGCVFGFPSSAEGASGLDGATLAQLAEVEAFDFGEALHWEELDADISVPGLLLHHLNVEAWYPSWVGGPGEATVAETTDRNEPRAGRAWYDAEQGLVMFEMQNGCIFGFPPSESPHGELAGFSADQLGKVELGDAGRVLLWPDIAAVIAIPGLLLHLLNVKDWGWKWLGGEKPAIYAAIDAIRNGRGRGQATETTRDVPAPAAHTAD